MVGTEAVFFFGFSVAMSYIAIRTLKTHEWMAAILMSFGFAWAIAGLFYFFTN